MKVTILLLIGFIASVHSAFASPTNDELVHALKNDAGRYDEACRGGSGGHNSTWVSCGKRDYAFVACPLSYKVGRQIGLSIGGSGSFV
jgi:hypothetical protein